MMRLGLLGLVLLVAAPGFGELLPDDHGNSAVTATVLPGGSNLVAGVFEYDTDVDVFSFPFLPARSYQIRVTTGTVWDVRLEVLPPAALSPLIETNTVWAHPLAATWTNPAAAARWHLLVSPQFAFTTGSYTLAVWESPFPQDADGDGMADAWELDTFGTTTNQAGGDVDGDGTLNLDEYLAGTAANNPDQAVKIDALNRSGPDDRVTWFQAPYAAYQLDTTTNLALPGQGWQPLGTRVSGGLPGTVVWTNEAAADGQRHYRVRFVY